MKTFRVATILASVITVFFLVGMANAFQLITLSPPIMVLAHVNEAMDAAKKWSEDPSDQDVAAVIHDQCSQAMDVVDPGDWVVKCLDLEDEGHRCGNRIGLMAVCEGKRCNQPTCGDDYDCINFAAFFGFKDSCRLYTCLNGQCVDQFDVIGSMFDAYPGLPCQSTTVSSDGMCNAVGDCKVFSCSTNADCPGYGLECAQIACDQTSLKCKPVPHPNGTPCTSGTCTNGNCQ
jgi:hypothetical protein